MTVGELLRLLDGVAKLYGVAGAKAPAQDLATFASAFAPHAAMPLDAFCAEAARRLLDAGRKPKARAAKRAKGTKGAAAGTGDKGPTGTSAAASPSVALHVARLRAAGTDQAAFDRAFEALVSDKSMKAADVAEVARRYANTVTKYKSTAAARADISKAFLRHIRFENKLL